MSRSETHEISIPEGDNPLVAITTKTGNQEIRNQKRIINTLGEPSQKKLTFLAAFSPPPSPSQALTDIMGKYLSFSCIKMSVFETKKVQNMSKQFFPSPLKLTFSQRRRALPPPTLLRICPLMLKGFLWTGPLSR